MGEDAHLAIIILLAAKGRCNLGLAAINGEVVVAHGGVDKLLKESARQIAKAVVALDGEVALASSLRRERPSALCARAHFVLK